jgi:hypothetical protein
MIAHQSLTSQQKEDFMKLEKATTGDIVLSVIIPGWGGLVGLIALIKKEVRRGLTMLGISALMILVISVLRA